MGLVYKASHKCHSDPTVAGEEPLIIHTTLLHLIKQRCFASLNVTAPLYGIDLCVCELVTRQAAKCLKIFRRRFLDHILRQTWRRRSLVPIERLQIIAHELFVEAGRALSYDVFIFRPEPRVRRARGRANRFRDSTFLHDWRFRRRESAHIVSCLCSRHDLARPSSPG